MAGDVRPTDDVRYRGISIAPRAGVQVSEGQIMLAILPAATENPPDNTVWRSPDPAATSLSGNVISVFVLAGPGSNWVLTAGYWRLWAKITGSPEIAYEKSPDYFCIV